jgi:hypothetical protein
MSKQILNEEFYRMQKLAGILNEEEIKKVLKEDAYDHTAPNVKGVIRKKQ